VAECKLYTGLLQNLCRLHEAAEGAGFFNLDPDPENVAGGRGLN